MLHFRNSEKIGFIEEFILGAGMCKCTLPPLSLRSDGPFGQGGVDRRFDKSPLSPVLPSPAERPSLRTINNGLRRDDTEGRWREGRRSLHSCNAGYCGCDGRERSDTDQLSSACLCPQSSITQVQMGNFRDPLINFGWRPTEDWCGAPIAKLRAMHAPSIVDGRGRKILAPDKS